MKKKLKAVLFDMDGVRQRRTFRILPDSEKQAAGHVGRFQQKIFPRTD